MDDQHSNDKKYADKIDDKSEQKERVRFHVSLVCCWIFFSSDDRIHQGQKCCKDLEIDYDLDHLNHTGLGNFLIYCWNKCN